MLHRFRLPILCTLLVAALLPLLATGAAAQATEDPSSPFADFPREPVSLIEFFHEGAEGDPAIGILQGIFPQIFDDYAPAGAVNGPPTIIGVLGGVISIIALALGGGWLVYFIIAGVLQSAHEGQVLGRQWSSLWAPIRIVVGLTLLMPFQNGWTGAQHLVADVIYISVGAANRSWDVATEQLFDATPVSMPFGRSSEGLAYETLEILTCEATYNMLAAESSSSAQLIGPMKIFESAQQEGTVPQLHQVRPSSDGSGFLGFEQKTNPVVQKINDLKAEKNLFTKSIRVGFGGPGHLPEDVCGSINYREMLNQAGTSAKADFDVIHGAFNEMVFHLRPLAYKIAASALRLAPGTAQKRADKIDRAFGNYADYGTNAVLTNGDAAQVGLLVLQNDAFQIGLEELQAAQIRFDTKLFSGAQVRLAELRAHNNSLDAFKENMADAGWLYAGAFIPAVRTLQAEFNRYVSYKPSVTSPDYEAIMQQSPRFGTKTYNAVQVLDALWRQQARRRYNKPETLLSVTPTSERSTFAGQTRLEEFCSSAEAWEGGSSNPAGAAPVEACGFAMKQHTERVEEVNERYFARTMFPNERCSVSTAIDKAQGNERLPVAAAFVDNCTTDDVGKKAFAMMSYLATPDSGDGSWAQPITALENLGIVLLGAGGIGEILSGTGVTKWASGIVDALSSIMMLAGGFLVFVFPLLPLIFFAFQIIAWIVRVLEMILFSPIWALAHFRPDGEGLAGPMATAGYGLLFRVLWQPITMVIGVLLTVAAIAGLIPLIADLMLTGIALAFEPTNPVIIGAFAVMLMVIVIIAVQLMNLISIGDRLGAWFDGNAEPSDAERNFYGLVGRIGGGNQQISGGLSRSAQQLGANSQQRRSRSRGVSGDLRGS